MGVPWLPQNPGIDLQQLTSAEIAVLASMAGLTDPNVDRIVFWDDSAGAFAFLIPGTGLDIAGTTLSVVAASIDYSTQFMLFGA